MPTSSAPTIAFLGATGGCTNACLVHSLLAGHNCIALVRDPQKLHSQLQSQGLSTTTLSHLTTIKGTALDIPSLKRLLTGDIPQGHIVTTIISGLGALPRFQLGWQNALYCITIDQPTLCGDAAKALVAAIKQVYSEQPSLKTHKPLCAFVSTTGISKGAEDVPWYHYFLYHYVLVVPHQDKRIMEDTLRGGAESRDDQGRVFSGFVGVRPTLLAGTAVYTDAVGLKKIRVGTEEKPAKGFTIKRADVGHWMFENIIGSRDGREYWTGKIASLTA